MGRTVVHLHPWFVLENQAKQQLEAMICCFSMPVDMTRFQDQNASDCLRIGNRVSREYAWEYTMLTRSYCRASFKIRLYIKVVCNESKICNLCYCLLATGEEPHTSICCWLFWGGLDSKIGSARLRIQIHMSRMACKRLMNCSVFYWDLKL